MIDVIVAYWFLTGISLASKQVQKQVRGKTVGKGTMKAIAKNGGERLHVPVPEGLNTFTGLSATPTVNEIGLQLRRLCPIQGVLTWRNIDDGTKAAIAQAVLVILIIFTLF